MIKNALFASLLLTAAPALAQTAQPSGPVDPNAPATTTTSNPNATAAPTTATPPVSADQPATTTAPATEAPGADAATTPSTDAQAPAAEGGATMATINADWATYDTNKNGSLSRTELSSWLTALQTASGAKAPGKSYLAAAFQKADADKSKSVSKEELAVFLKS